MLDIHESERHAVMRANRLLDPVTEERFDRITRTGARLFGAPIAVISMLDDDRQWFKSAYGVSFDGVFEARSFCRHVVATGEPLLVADARLDERFCDDSGVLLGVRFYAGYPLRASNGTVVGTFCVAGHEVREVSDDDLLALRDLACWAERELNWVEQQVALDQRDEALRVVRETGRLFEETSRMARLGYWAHHGGTGQVFWSRETYRIMGVEDPTFTPTFEFFLQRVVGCDRERIRTAIDAAYRDKVPLAFETKLRMQDGTERHVRVESFILDDAQDGTATVLGLLQDITARKEAERARLETEAQLRAIVEHSPDSIYIRDNEGRYLLANPACARGLGYPVALVLGRTNAELLGYDVSQHLSETDREVFSGRTVEAYEHTLTNPLGETRTFVAQKFPYRSPEGECLGVIGISTDISDRKVYETLIHQQAAELQEALSLLQEQNARMEREIAERTHELRQQKALLERLPGRVPALIAYIDRDLTLNWANPQMAAWLHRTQPELVGRHMKDLIPGLGDPFLDFLKGVMSEGMAVERSDPSTHDPRGVEHHWDSTFVPIHDGNGEAMGLFAMSLDVSDRVEKVRLQAEQIEALRQADALKDEFLNVLSHELRTPLTAIVGVSNLFECEALGPLTPKQRYFLGKLMASAEMLTNLVNDLLDSSLIQAGKLSIIPRSLDLEELVATQLSPVRLLAAQRSIGIEVDMPADLPPITADDRRLGQILINLVGNAVRYGDEGSRVSLVGRMTDAGVRCEIRDEGPGIAAEDLPLLFKRFSRLPHTSDRNGTGLGLSICKALVEAHGGTIGVESEPGRGSTFWFVLPQQVD